MKQIKQKMGTYNRTGALQRLLQSQFNDHSQSSSANQFGAPPIAIGRPFDSLPAAKIEKTANAGSFTFNLARFPLSDSCTVHLVERRISIMKSNGGKTYKQDFELSIIRHEEYANFTDPNALRSPLLCLSEAEWLWLKQSIHVIDAILLHTKRINGLYPTGR